MEKGATETNGRARFYQSAKPRADMTSRERRMGRRLLDKWAAASESRLLPSLQGVESGAEAEVLDRSFVIDVTPGPGAYRFSRFGAKLRDMIGDDYTGRRVDSLPSHIAGDAMDLCHAAISAAKPVGRSEDLALLFGRAICFRLLVLPVANEQHQIDALVGTVGYKFHQLESSARPQGAD